MKKIIFLVVICSGLVKVNALSGVNYLQNRNPVCDSNNEKFPIYNVFIDGNLAFFLNKSKAYNLNFEDYYEISFEESPYSENIKYYSNLIEKEYRTNLYYVPSIHRILWEKLYPNESFNMCSLLSVKEEQYNQIKSYMEKINKGPSFIQSFTIQDSNKLYTYEDENLDKFVIVENNGLDVQIDNNILMVSGSPGEYQLVFQRKDYIENIIDTHLYTDGENYLVQYTNVPDIKYIWNIKIPYPKYEILIKNEEGVLLKNICLSINEDVYCSDENGQILILGNSDTYKVSLIDNTLYMLLNDYLRLNENNEIILKEVVVKQEDEKKENNNQDVANEEENIEEEDVISGEESEVVPDLPIEDEAPNVSLEEDNNDQNNNNEPIVEENYNDSLLPEEELKEEEEKIEIDIEDTSSYSFSLLIMGILFVFVYKM